jgi:hypothetical protein
MQWIYAVSRRYHQVRVPLGHDEEDRKDVTFYPVFAL